MKTLKTLLLITLLAPVLAFAVPVSLEKVGTYEYLRYLGDSFGIGTTTPTYKLTVGGDINFTGNLYQNGILFTSGGGGATTTINGFSGPAFTFATSSATGIGLNITGSGSTITFTPTVTSGYVIPLTASTTQWATAFASTTALTPAYIRGLFSNTATGLTYNSSTGATSLTANYIIPLTASTTNWNTFYNTPSNRITAGSNLSWSGNTLNATIATSSINYLRLVSGGLETSTSTDFLRSAFFTATSTTASSTFAGAVGIGTTSPDKLFTVTGDQSNGIVKFERVNSATTAVLTTAIFKGRSTGTLAAGSGTGFTFALQGNGTAENTLALISAVRNGADNTGAIRLAPYTAGSASWSGMYVDGLNLTASIGTNLSGATLGVVGNTAKPTTDILSIASSSLEVFLAVKSTGLVGVATATPFKALTVQGEIFSTATTTAGGLQISAPATATSTAYIYSKQAGFGGAIILEDTGGGACTMITTSAGSINSVVVTCPTEI